MKNLALLILLSLLWCVPLTAQAAASATESVVTIYVEDNNGHRIATGNGLLISPDGTVATDVQIVLTWLETEDSSLILRAGKSSYYPVEALLSVDRESGVALFRTDAAGLKPADFDLNYVLSNGETISIVGSPEGLDVEKIKGIITDISSDGRLEISASVKKLLGVPVLNQQGKTIALASIREAHGTAVPIGDVLSLREEPVVQGQDDVTVNMTVVKKAKAAMRGGRADAEDYFRLGAAYKKAGMTEKAIEAFKESLRLKPDFAEAYQGLGVAYASEGLHEEALEALEKAVSIRPDYVEAHSNLGFLYDYLGRHEEAIESFHEALRLKPDYAEAHNGLGVSLARARNYEEAIESFKKALSIRPESRKARFNLALSYISLDDRESALAQERLLRNIDPEMADRLLDFLETDTETEETAEENYDEESPEDEGVMH